MKRRIDKNDAVLVVIDFQERLMPSVKNSDELEATMIKMIKGCQTLQIPIIVTQQYPKGLGQTVKGMKEVLGEAVVIDKTDFSCCGEPLFMEELKKTGRKTVIVTGIEAHVCVQQTVMDLLDQDYDVFVLVDGISSRSNNDKKYAQRRMSEAGAVGTTYEAALFEMTVTAKAPEFKAISAIVK